MSEQMKLCMCGLPAQSYTTESANGIIRYAIGCNDPLCHWTAGEYATEAEAIAAWNQRAGEADYRRLRELERACDTLWCERRQDGTRCMASPTEHSYSKEETQQLDAAINAIGRLLEEEG